MSPDSRGKLLAFSSLRRLALREKHVQKFFRFHKYFLVEFRMDGQDDPRRGFRLVPRAPRRYLNLQRRNIVHYCFQNLRGNVTISNHFVPNGAAPRPPYPAGAPLQLAVYGPNGVNAFPGYFQAGYVPVAPMPYVAHQAMPYGMPFIHARGPPPRFGNGTNRRVVNGNVHIGHVNAIAPRLMHVAVPRAVNIPAPRIINAAPPQMRLPAPRDIPNAVAPLPSAYIVAPDGSFVTIPSSIYTPPTVALTTMPINSHIATVTYTYSPPPQNVLPHVPEIYNAAEIVEEGDLLAVEDGNVLAVEEDDLLSVEELQITEFEASGSNEESN